MFTTAAVDGTKVCADLLKNPVVSGMDAADWMTMSAMRDTENALADYEGTASENISAMTMPGEVSEWMEEILGCAKTANYTSYMWGERSNAEKVNQLMKTHGKDVVVAVLVDADEMQNIGDAFNVPDHWVRLLSPIQFNGDKVEMLIFT